jgi:hypothetical protein
MNKERMEAHKWIECDGCQYAIGRTSREAANGLRLDRIHMTVSIPVDLVPENDLTFHFHVANDEARPDDTRGLRDCFRYWAHNPSIMKRSLKERGMDDDDIDTFMSQFLYRTGTSSLSPGVEREKQTTKTRG